MAGLAISEVSKDAWKNFSNKTKENENENED